MKQLVLPALHGSKVIFPDIPAPGTSAVVVHSGGQDSTTCLGYALKYFEKVHTLTFAYGQNHENETLASAEIASSLGVESHTTMNIGILKEIGDSALVTGGDVNAAHPSNKDLPASFVPNRNALFLTSAHAFAQKVGASHVITGVCQTDYSGYPDCREAFIESLEQALNLGADVGITISTPLMFLDKAQTFQLAEDVGVLETVLERSLTCYNGVTDKVHDWGMGCGDCPSCQLRKKGWEEYQSTKVHHEV